LSSRSTIEALEPAWQVCIGLAENQFVFHARVGAGNPRVLLWDESDNSREEDKC